MNNDNCLRFMECQVCSEFVLKTHYVCENGHRICSECMENNGSNNYDFMVSFNPNSKRAKLRLSKCGLCRSTAINRVTDNLVMEIHEAHNTTKPCKYVGCDETPQCTLYSDHLKICKYKPIRCPHKYCDFAFNNGLNNEIEFNTSTLEIKNHCVEDHKCVDRKSVV